MSNIVIDPDNTLLDNLKKVIDPDKTLLNNLINLYNNIKINDGESLEENMDYRIFKKYIKYIANSSTISGNPDKDKVEEILIVDLFGSKVKAGKICGRGEEAYRKAYMSGLFSKLTPGQRKKIKKCQIIGHALNSNVIRISRLKLSHENILKYNDGANSNEAWKRYKGSYAIQQYEWYNMTHSSVFGESETEEENMIDEERRREEEETDTTEQTETQREVGTLRADDDSLPKATATGGRKKTRKCCANPRCPGNYHCTRKTRHRTRSVRRKFTKKRNRSGKKRETKRRRSSYRRRK